MIIGRVQGVGYRYHLRSQAERLGIKGWCRNLNDGHVEAEVFGPLEQIEALLVWCHQGPPAAKVSEILVHELPLEGSEPPSDFEIRHTC